jgi:hypothetical protein
VPKTLGMRVPLMSPDLRTRWIRSGGGEPLGIRCRPLSVLPERTYIAFSYILEERGASTSIRRASLYRIVA